IADKGNGRIRKVDTTGTISTVAGGVDAMFDPPLGDGGPATEASLSSPADVFVDGAGAIFILEVGRRRVRKVGSQGIISTVVGAAEIEFNAPGEFYGDGGPASSAALYVNSSVYSSGGGIFIDGEGDLYIADRGNHRIRKVEGVAAPTDLWAEAPTVKTPDFDGSGTVDFPDFVEFARNFNKSEGDVGYDARFDLDGDGKVSFPDFVVFATAFGKAA
ncbi:MAG: EF-hand domain-containing protein, partial [Candidatus Latescibacteria bacterium]|nr:EF-hand domain-containing protein [Candidatus Latescibacterota bacterium]